MVKILSVGEIEYIAFSLAKVFLEFDEPIPYFSTRFPHKLESSIAAPFQTFGKKELYKGLTLKGAALFYFLIKNHPFQNGNKRIAVTSLLIFLYKNEKWLRVDNKELYNFAVWVAGSPSTVKDQTIEAIDVFIKKYLINN